MAGLAHEETDCIARNGDEGGGEMMATTKIEWTWDEFPAQG